MVLVLSAASWVQTSLALQAGCRDAERQGESRDREGARPMGRVGGLTLEDRRRGGQQATGGRRTGGAEGAIKQGQVARRQDQERRSGGGRRLMVAIESGTEVAAAGVGCR